MKKTNREKASRRITGNPVKVISTNWCSNAENQAAQIGEEEDKEASEASRKKYNSLLENVDIPGVRVFIVEDLEK